MFLKMLSNGDQMNGASHIKKTGYKAVTYSVIPIINTF